MMMREMMPVAAAAAASEREGDARAVVAWTIVCRTVVAWTVGIVRRGIIVPSSGVNDDVVMPPVGFSRGCDGKRPEHYRCEDQFFDQVHNCYLPPSDSLFFRAHPALDAPRFISLDRVCVESIQETNRI